MFFSYENKPSFLFLYYIPINRKSQTFLGLGFLKTKMMLIPYAIILSNSFIFFLLGKIITPKN